MYEILKDIIYKKSQLNSYNSNENSFYIRENDSLAECKRVDLLKFESENTTFGFELDCKSIKKISLYFENGKNLDKGNDAIIFTTIKNQKYVFICELKDGAKGYVNQFKSSYCFVEYLKAILQNIYNKDIGNIIVKYILFSKKGSIKTQTNGKYISSIQQGIEIYHVNCKKKKYYIESFV